MARNKTMDELLAEAEAGKSGSTMGEQERKQREQVPDEGDKDKKKKKRGFFEGRRALRTILNVGGGDEE
jgi:hypothetical protein